MKIYWNAPAAGIAEFQVHYCGKIASIEITGLDTTGGPVETYIDGETFYKKRLEELAKVILEKNLPWYTKG